MFPPQLARVLVEWLSDPGDIVYDPFSGRGTVALESVLSGRTAWAGDANPLAVALSRAKVGLPSASGVTNRLAELGHDYQKWRSFADPNEQPDEIKMLYSAATLRQLCFLHAWNTYWGGKLIFKAGDASTYVATVPLASVTGTPALSDYAGLDEVLSVLGELRCSMYDNALIPVALANKLVSLSDFPSSRILEKFAKSKLT